MIMIMKKTGIAIAAAAAVMILSGCSTSPKMPGNSSFCDTPSATSSNACKSMSSCKSASAKKLNKLKKHLRYSAENTQPQMNA